MLGIFFLQTAHSMIIHQELLVEPEVIVPEDTIYLPQVYREIDLTCSGQEDLPDGGRFSSPGWTEEFVYANNLNCSWTLGRRGCTTEVDFYEIDIEDLHLLRKCPYDKLTISTGDQQLNRELCGRSPPEIFRVFGPISVKFTSDKTVQRRGWTAVVNVYDCHSPLEEKKSAVPKKSTSAMIKPSRAETTITTSSTPPSTTTTYTTTTTVTATTTLPSTTTTTATTSSTTTTTTTSTTSSTTSTTTTTTKTTTTTTTTSSSTTSEPSTTVTTTTTPLPTTNEATTSESIPTTTAIKNDEMTLIVNLSENDVEYEAIILESSGIGSGDGSGEEIQIDVLDLVNEESVFLEYNPFDYMSDFPIRSDQK